MARRRTRRKPTRRRATKTFNLASLAESALIANAVTHGFFNTTLAEFAGKSNLAPNQITARELFRGITGQSGGYGTQVTGGTAPGGYQLTLGSPFGQTVRTNLQNNGIQMVGQLILIPVGFKAFNKLTSKPRAQINKAMRMGGLPVKV
jgi:hypothetical protein